MASGEYPSYTLRYFNMIGRAEACRLLLTAAKVKWTEEHPEWPQEKEKQPFGHLPVLIEKRADGSELVLSESSTIERFLARTYGFLPLDPTQSAIQEQIRDEQWDVLNAFIFVIMVHGDEDKKAGMDRFNDLFNRMVKVHMGILNANANKKHLFGDKLSFADISLYGFYKITAIHFLQFREDACELTKAKVTPEILSLLASIEAEPLLKNHFSTCESLVARLS